MYSFQVINSMGALYIKKNILRSQKWLGTSPGSRSLSSDLSPEASAIGGSPAQAQNEVSTSNKYGIYERLLKADDTNVGPSHFHTMLAYMQAIHRTAIVQDIGHIDFS